MTVISFSIRFLSDERRWVDRTPTEGHITPYSRLRSVFEELEKPADEEPSGSNLDVVVNGSTLKVTDHLMTHEVVDIRRWASTAQRAIVELKAGIDGLLPSGISLQQFSDISSRVTDNHSLEGMHRQSQNSSLLDPIRNHIRDQLLGATGSKSHDSRHGLFSPTGVGRVAAERYLAHDQLKVLGPMATAFATTSGISIDGHIFKYLRFDSTEIEHRNIWKLKNDIIIFSDPSAKPRENHTTPVVFSLPPDMTLPITFYLTIMRPIICEILDFLGQNIAPFRSIVWAHVHRHPRYRVGLQWSWSGVDISAHVQRFTYQHLSIALTPSNIRQINKKLFLSAFPRLFETSFTSIVDQQGQHLGKTSVINYGQLRYLPTIKNVRADQPVRFLAMSQIWQALLGIGPVGEVWRNLVLGSGIFPPLPTDCAIALEKTRHTIRLAYRLGATPNDNQRAWTILKHRPFLFSTDVGSFITLPSIIY